MADAVLESRGHFGESLTISARPKDGIVSKTVLSSHFGYYPATHNPFKGFDPTIRISESDHADELRPTIPACRQARRPTQPHDAQQFLAEVRGGGGSGKACRPDPGLSLKAVDHQSRIVRDRDLPSFELYGPCFLDRILFECFSIFFDS